MAAALYLPPFTPAFNSNVVPIPGALLYFFYSGTENKAPIYQDAALTVPLVNPVQANLAARFPAIYFDNSVKYRVRLTDSNGSPVGSDVDPYILGDGLDAVYLDTSPSVMASGGSLDITKAGVIDGISVSPARGNVHSYDYATVGTNNVLTNSAFSGNPATGWSLTNFTSGNPGINHVTGTVATATQTISVTPYTMYYITIVLTTTTRGGIGFYFNNDNLLTGDDKWVLPVEGESTYTFPWFSYANTGNISIDLRTNEFWGGSVKTLSLVKVQQEAPYDFFGVSSDNKSLKNPFVVRFGRFVSGNIGIGDRQTLSLAAYPAAWNIALGSRSLSNVTTQFENTAVGAFALEYNEADRNSAGGYSSFRYNKRGIQNTGWGYKSGAGNSTGSYNSRFGFHSGIQCKTGDHNTSVGNQADEKNEYGSYNSSLGSFAGNQSWNGVGNVFVGATSGPYNSNSNILFTYNYTTNVGTESKTYGNNNTVLGYSARVGSDPNNSGTAVSNSTAIGNGAVSTSSNQTTLGDTNTMEVRTSAFVYANNTRGVPIGGAQDIGFKATNTPNLGVFFGSGVPTVSAAKGSLYLRTDGSAVNNRMYVNTDGGTTWTAVTTAA